METISVTLAGNNHGQNLKPQYKVQLSIKAGIAGVGVYIPRFRICMSEISRQHGRSTARNSGVTEKSVPGQDEDSATLGIEAAQRGVKNTENQPTRVTPTLSTNSRQGQIFHI